MTEDPRPGKGQDGALQQRHIDDEVHATTTRLTERDAERDADLGRRETAADERDATADRRDANADRRDEERVGRASALDQRARAMDAREADLDQAQDDQSEIDQEVRASRGRMRR